MNRWSKLGLLGSLYLSQGLPYGFFTQALPVLLRTQGSSLPAIGLSSLLTLPWALKFIWAPLLDRRAHGRHGRRRGAILPLQLLAALTMLAVSSCDPRSGLGWVMGAVLLTNLLAATQDIATDGLAVELLTPSERGLGNGVQVGAYRVGMIIGGGLMLILIGDLGWAVTFITMAGMLIVATAPIFFFREQAVEPLPAAERPRLLEGLKREGLFGWLVLLLIYKAGESFATGMLRSFLVDAGLDLADVGRLLGGVGFTAGLAGALTGGALIGRFDRRRSLLGFAMFQALAVASYALAAAAPSLQVLYLVAGFEHFASGMATAGLFTVMMDGCRPGFEATDYTIQASTVVIATGSFAALSGFSAQAFGYPLHFLLSAGIAAAAAVYVGFLPERTRAFGLGAQGAK